GVGPPGRRDALHPLHRAGLGGDVARAAAGGAAGPDHRPGGAHAPRRRGPAGRRADDRGGADRAGPRGQGAPVAAAHPAAARAHHRAHRPLPPAHTIAPPGGSVLLAGVLLKMGTYGLVRIAVPVLPDGMHVLAPWLGAFGVIGILWGGLVCLVERDLKRLIAMSSVAHMGFVLLGIASMTPQGLQGALFANVAHGLITGLLFFVAGAVKDRHHTADLAALGRDLRDRLPRLGWLLAFGAIAGLGLPGLAGFWGELLCITGAWQGTGGLGW